MCVAFRAHFFWHTGDSITHIGTFMKTVLAILIIPILAIGYLVLILRREKHTQCQRCEAPFEKPQRFAYCKQCWAAMGLKR